MWQNIREYVDMIVNIVNPQKLIFFAIDGVAPRAKMNQQRGRRFKSAKDITSGIQRKQKLANLWGDEGIELPDHFTQDTHWDHNVITPGTEFMEKVSLVIKVRQLSLIYFTLFRNTSSTVSHTTKNGGDSRLSTLTRLSLEKESISCWSISESKERCQATIRIQGIASMELMPI